ncbi:MAG TPA: alpha/beta hydrolase [Flavipsychrobacter sp.]|nr:alpha/beta hydrolase [Flavipsychrobacter sp.]
MKSIYCISGLGADHRIFKKLSIKNAELIHIPWLKYDKNESVSHYAEKLSAKIPGDNPTILGLSFGGMLAVEIAKGRATEKIFLISSSKTANELPRLKGFLKFIIQSNLLPAGFFTIPNRIIFKRFGADTKEKRELLADILKDTDGGFVKWALRALLSWDNSTYPGNVTHIHGTTDRILPSELVHPDYWIEKGTHMMVYDRADEIGNIISKHL